MRVRHCLHKLMKDENILFAVSLRLSVLIFYSIDIVNNHILPNVVCSGVMTKREAKAKNLLASHWDQYVTLKKVCHHFYLITSEKKYHFDIQRCFQYVFTGR